MSRSVPQNPAPAPPLPFRRPKRRSLSGRQKRLALALAAGQSFAAAARSEAVSESGVRKLWKRSEAFRDTVAEAEAETLAEAISKLRTGASAAVSSLLNLLSREMRTPEAADTETVRKLCDTLLSHARTFREADAERRLHEIERRLDITRPRA